MPLDRTEVREPRISNGHHWWIWKGMELCKTCMIVRRDDDKNKPCRGASKIVFRDESYHRVPKPEDPANPSDVHLPRSASKDA